MPSHTDLPIVSLLGLQDKSSEIAAADKAERILADALQADYAQYLISPDEVSAARLKVSLDAVIEKVEKNILRAKELNQKALKEANRQSGFSSKFRTFFSLEHTHYEQLEVKYAHELEKLLQLRDRIQTFNTDTSNYKTSQRRLLQTSNTSSQPVTTTQYCYPTANCNVTDLMDGFSGVLWQGMQPSDFYGYSVIGGGDINGDGYPDVVVGRNPLGSIGNTHIVFGTNKTNAWSGGTFLLNNLMDGQRGFVLLGERPSDQYGWAVSMADINGDNLDDIIIAAPNLDRVSVIFGSSSKTAWSNGQLNVSSFMDGQRGFMYQGPGNEASGYSLCTADDFNGDGLPDIVIGIPAIATGIGNKIIIVFGSSNSSAWGNGTLTPNSFVNGQRGLIIQGESTNNDLFGFKTAAGDFNNDGLSDVIIGAPQGAPPLRGKTYVVFGNRTWNTGLVNVSSLLDGNRGFVLIGETPYETSGNAVGVADLNGDGKRDLFIGAPAAAPNSGKVYVVFGGNNSAFSTGTVNISSLMDGQQGLTFQRGVEVDNFGSCVSDVGDINQDGLSDILIGAPRAGSNTGMTYIVFASKNNSLWNNGTLNIDNFMDGQSGFSITGGGPGEFFGASADTAGNFNGEGPAFVVGTRSSSNTRVIFGGLPSLYFTTNSFTISSGATLTLSPQHVNLGTNLTNVNLGNIHINIVNPSNGFFSLAQEPAVSITSFFMQNITNLAVLFTHTGNNVPPICELQVKQGARYAVSKTKFNFVGYPPSLENNELTAFEGQPITLGPNQLSANDQDDPPSHLVFIISSLRNGQFTLLNATANISSPVTNFTQQNIIDRLVSFIPDGSPNSPGYLVAVSDGKSTTPSQAASVQFNHAPVLTLNPGMIFDQGQGTIFTSQDINATDVETFNGVLVFRTRNVTSGYFSYTSKPGTRINEFQQLSVTTGAVQFVHDGSATIPSFEVQASDGYLSSRWEKPIIFLNHRPIPQGTIPPPPSIRQDEEFSFVLPLPLFFNDPDNDPLTYKPYLRGTSILPEGITFTPPGSFSGNFPNMGTYTIGVNASDPRGLTGTNSFILNVAESQAAYYKSFYSGLSGVIGFVSTIAIYCYIRRRIARHRRDFPFVNDLRKILNLEYFDFSRFDGDSFKTIFNDFIEQLENDYDQFYTKLSPEEQRSFAICVAEILVRRKLVSQSDWSSGCFGILCCLNIGWPSILNLHEFKDQRKDIAAEAIGTWKEIAGYKLTPLAEAQTHGYKYGTIYFEMKEEGNLYYQVKDRYQRADRNYSGIITPSDLGLKAIPIKLKELESYKSTILTLTHVRGDTRADKALKQWEYHSNSFGDKLRVFFHCQKSPSKQRFGEFPSKRRLDHGVELQALATRGSDHKEENNVQLRSEPQKTLWERRLAKLEHQFDELEDQETTPLINNLPSNKGPEFFKPRESKQLSVVSLGSASSYTNGSTQLSKDSPVDSSLGDSSVGSSHCKT